ncbi:MAG: iron ABC transporter permease [Crocinitomicaceae bacterium]|nr:iron ABC transporter permease [Crocinitomicaceae bacterium]
MKRGIDGILIVVLMVGILLLFAINLSYGDASISWRDLISILFGELPENDSWSYIVEYRLNRSIVAVLGGGALAVSGLLLQVFFRNPLAGPGVLGITSGASLGVALVMLGGISVQNVLGGVSVIFSGTIGAIGVLFLLLFISRFVRNQVTLLVIGLMLGYFTSAFVNMLFLWADQNATREFVIWGLGSFEGLETPEVILFSLVILVFISATVFMIKGLNGMVLGTEYSRSLGINLRVQKVLMIIITSVLAAVVTVYCGPISFIGIAVPQLIRVIGKSRNHAVLIPMCFLGGGLLGIFADLLVRLADNTLPLNTVTALIGAPIIIWTIIKMNKRFVGV